MVLDSNREPAHQIVPIHHFKSRTRRSGKALTGRSDRNMPQHDGDSLECMRGDADRER